MQQKIETTQKDADIFIYGKIDPGPADQILFGKAEILEKNSQFSSMTTQLHDKGEKLWLIRDSRVEGLLTIQSISFRKFGGSGIWVANEPERYMLSNNKGWIINSSNPSSESFKSTAKEAGGIIKMTEENVSPHLPGLLKLLSENGYHPENRINPKIGEETKTKAYSTYKVKDKNEGHSVHLKALSVPLLQSTVLSLPEGILISLSCPLTAVKTGEVKLMIDPVTLTKDLGTIGGKGISYERTTLLEKYPSLQEGIDFYPNVKLKTIINYVSANFLEPKEYLAKLDKVENDIQDPILLVDMENPVLSPSGQSYEKDSIEQWITAKKADGFWGNPVIPDPVTKENIADKSLVDNVNLRQFIKAWPSFYKQQQRQQEIFSDIPSIS